MQEKTDGGSVVFDGPAGRLAIRADGSPPVWVKAEGSAAWPRRHVPRLGDPSPRSFAGEIEAVDMDADCWAPPSWSSAQTLSHFSSGDAQPSIVPCADWWLGGEVVDSSAKCNTTKLLRQIGFLGSLSKI